MNEPNQPETAEKPRLLLGVEMLRDEVESLRAQLTAERELRVAAEKSRDRVMTIAEHTTRLNDELIAKVKRLQSDLAETTAHAVVLREALEGLLEVTNEIPCSCMICEHGIMTGKGDKCPDSVGFELAVSNSKSALSSTPPAAVAALAEYVEALRAELVTLKDVVGHEEDWARIDRLLSTPLPDVLRRVQDDTRRMDFHIKEMEKRGVTITREGIDAAMQPGEKPQ